jgi:hypothetical protein
MNPALAVLHNCLKGCQPLRSIALQICPWGTTLGFRKATTRASMLECLCENSITLVTGKVALSERSALLALPTCAGSCSLATRASEVGTSGHDGASSGAWSLSMLQQGGSVQANESCMIATHMHNSQLSSELDTSSGGHHAYLSARRAAALTMLRLLFSTSTAAPATSTAPKTIIAGNTRITSTTEKAVIVPANTVAIAS